MAGCDRLRGSPNHSKAPNAAKPLLEVVLPRDQLHRAGPLRVLKCHILRHARHAARDGAVPARPAARRAAPARYPRGLRALGCFAHAELVLRWFIDGTRIAELATGNAISAKTVYRYLHEGIDVLAAHAPDLRQALAAARGPGLSHVNLDGVVIPADRVKTRAPTAPTCDGRASTSATAATSRSSPRRTGGRCGHRPYGPAVSTTRPAPERTG